MPFADEVVLITGAGSGIGRAMAQEFNAEGATVAALDVHAGAAKQTAESLGGDASAVVADLRSRADVDRAVAEVIERHGRIDVLCNNAGVLDGYADALNTSDELWDNIIATNLTGPFMMSRAALPHMIERGSGAIVNTASTARACSVAARKCARRGRRSASARVTPNARPEAPLTRSGRSASSRHRKGRVAALFPSR